MISAPPFWGLARKEVLAEEEIHVKSHGTRMIHRKTIRKKDATYATRRSRRSARPTASSGTCAAGSLLFFSQIDGYICTSRPLSSHQCNMDNLQQLDRYSTSQTGAVKWNTTVPTLFNQALSTEPTKAGKAARQEHTD